MQSFCYSLLRAYVRLGLQFYFRKIIIHGADNIPKGPVLFAPNHQNAFMDALLIVCFERRPVYFLTRADIFKSSLSKWILGFLRMIPIYRIRDGIESLGRNQETFTQCASLFRAGNSIVIFPEGNHGNERRVRAVGKGFTRIIAETLQQHPELNVPVVPVGLNYSDPKSFRASVSMYFGKPLELNHRTNDSRIAVNQLRTAVEVSLKELTMHVEDPSRYQEVVRALEISGVDFLNPTEVNQRIKKILIDGLSEFENQAGKRGAYTSGVVAKILSLVSSIINFIPLMIWSRVRRGIKDPVFTGSLKFAVGIFVFPAFYVVIAILIFLIWGLAGGGLWLAVSVPSMLLRR